ncbi:signal peptidase I [Cellulomonas sp. DKR-3]|uniref:Signal peptidase I n=1 Tax=Cellulomonas fulva TaxID=2835530 RepID=A0ABS5TY86_9CELL|nr:signal peptidase I [Cellulomonas fulva]
MPRSPRHPSAPAVERRDVRRPAPPPREPRPRWRTALSAVLWTVVALGTLAYATSLAVPLWFQAHDQRLLIVTSGSMAPVFDAGDAVVMRRVDDPSQLKVDQIVSFWPLGSERLVTHRIVDLVTLPTLKQDDATGRMVPVVDPETGEPAESQYIITKGDANKENDENATPYTRVRGIVLDVHPGWGWVLQWAGSATGRAIMLVPPLVALGTLELLAVQDARRRKKVRLDHRNRDERHVDAYLHG